MTRPTADVTFKSADPARLPDALSQPAVLLVGLQRRGVVDTIAKTLKVRRQGGYCGLDLWIFLLVYYAAGASKGIKTFYADTLKPVKKRVAALARRRDMPSSSSASRALSAVEADLLRQSTTALLMDIADVDDLLHHPAIFSYDARGERWHLFDLDGTVTTLRHRALPTAEDLPEPQRRSEDTAEPGYGGRKRGEMQFRRMTVQHAGSALWTWAHLSPGNGDRLKDLELALDSVVACCARLGHALDHTMVRMDGEFGSVPYFTACRARKLPFVTRIGRTKLYHDPEILGRMRQATWYRVPDSGSGPSRVAADLGVMTIAPDKKTRTPEGEKYEPITIRIVASAFVSDGKKDNRGKVLDGWQVELFVADLDPVAWPAAEVVAAYFGRASQENRFGQEDRELHLDRIASFHLPGQELACVVALSLWNLRVVEGFAAHRPADVAPRQAPSTPVVDERQPQGWPRDPVLTKALSEVAWEEALARRPGWSFDADRGELRCPDGRVLNLTTVRPAPTSPTHTSLIFRRPQGGCESCAAREGCLRTERPLASKHAEIQADTKLAEGMRKRLVEVRRVASEARQTPNELALPMTEPLTVLPSLFLPARARQAFDSLFLGASLRVEVTETDAPIPRLELVADSPEQRQRQRLTWEQNLERYALDEKAKVALEVTGGRSLDRWLGDEEKHQPPLRGTG